LCQLTEQLIIKLTLVVTVTCSILLSCSVTNGKLLLLD